MGEDPINAQHGCDLAREMLRAHLDTELCDFELVCNGQSIRLHKIVICLQSPVFKAACTGSFEETSGRYEIKDCDIDSVRRMVNFLYKGYYQWEKSEEIHEIAIHIALYSLADKYLIDSLLDKSMSHFREAVEGEEDINILSQYTKVIYGLPFDSSNSLRSILKDEFRHRLGRPAAEPYLHQSLEGLIGEIPGFAQDMALSYIRQPISTCPCKEKVSVKKVTKTVEARKRPISDSDSESSSDSPKVMKVGGRSALVKAPRLGRR